MYISICGVSSSLESSSMLNYLRMSFEKLFMEFQELRRFEVEPSNHESYKIFANQSAKKKS